MYEDGIPAAMGAFIDRPGHRPLCIRCRVPKRILQQLQVRKQQIGQLEALAALIGPLCFPELFRDADCLHFIDNTSALAGCIKGSSGVEDSNRIYQILHLKIATLRCRYWCEYVESQANLVDEPSRDGKLCCPQAEKLGAKIIECHLPTDLDLWASRLSDLRCLARPRHITA